MERREYYSYIDNLNSPIICHSPPQHARVWLIVLKTIRKIWKKKCGNKQQKFLRKELSEADKTFKAGRATSSIYRWLTKSEIYIGHDAETI